jgi:hypothetical protein
MSHPHFDDLSDNSNFTVTPEAPKSGIAMQFAESIAAWSRFDAQMPDPHAETPRGRECYAWTEEEDWAFELFETEMSKVCFNHRLKKDVDYTVHTDAVGNMFFTILGKGNKADEKWNTIEVLSNEQGFIMGSHLDSTPNGGMYDGVIWVGSGMEAIDNLLKNGKPKKSITLVAWRWEESSPNNGVGCLGSQIATGQINMEQIEKIIYKKDKEGKDLLFLQHLAYRNWVSVEAMKEGIRKMIAKNGEYFRKNYEFNIEIHVEQSPVVEKNNVDVWIVTWGIGWAQREKHVKSTQESEKAYKTSKYDFHRMRISGTRAHTGGTPPNPKNKKSELGQNETWYRDDALVWLSALVGLLLKSTIVREIWYGLSLGYTSVPDDTYIDIAISRWEALDPNFRNTLKDYGVGFSHKANIPLWNEFRGYSLEAIYDELRLPLNVSHIATERVSQEIKDNPGNSVWVSRVTLVDLLLKDGKLTYNLDYRHVWERETFDSLINSVKRAVGEWVEMKVISSGLSAKVSDVVVNILIKKAEELWFSYICMPSSPGHDAGYVAKTGVKTSMIFIGHNGISHNPREHMDAERLKKPLKLLEEVLRDFAY